MTFFEKMQFANFDILDFYLRIINEHLIFLKIIKIYLEN